MTKPTIACLFRQTVSLNVAPAALLSALQAYVDQCLTPAWGVSCQLVLEPQAPAGCWTLTWYDDADQAGELGDHDDQDGVPFGRVFVRTAQRDGEPHTVVASHELAEMLVDPGANLGAYTPRGRWAALEVADPVEGTTFKIAGLDVANFVYPEWFGQPGSQYDHLHVCPDAWHILSGGYLPVYQNGQWSDIFGTLSAQRSHQKKDRRLHRAERRARRLDATRTAEGATNVGTQV